jgi:hypothetical protein
MELGHLLTRSGLTYPEVFSKDTVYRRKRIVYQVGNKDKINYTEMHGQQNMKM